MASFCGFGRCSFQISCVGRKRIMMSWMIFGTELPRNHLVLSKQCPPSMYGSYAFWTGMHWKMVTKMAVTYQAPTRAPIMYTPAFMNGVGKIRRYMTRIDIF